MPRIIGVHGVGQQNTKPDRLREEWWRALGAVLPAANAGAGPTARLGPADFNVVYYADLYSTPGLRGLGREYDVHDLSTDWEKALALALGAAAAEVTGANRETTRFVFIPGNVQRALDLLLRVPGMGSLTESTLVAWFIKEVYRYLHEPAIRRAAIGRVHDALRPVDARVVIAHSLGSVVAYEALCQKSFNVDTLITIGSPLGLREVVHGQFNPRPGSGRLAWPGTVRRWVNIAQPGDVVAMRKDLNPLFETGPAGRGIEDHLVPDPAGLFQAHNAAHYLRVPRVGEIIQEALA